MNGSGSTTDADLEALQAEIQRLTCENTELKHALKTARGEVSPDGTTGTEESCTSAKTDPSTLSTSGSECRDESDAVVTKKQLKQALKSIKVFKQQQQQLFDEFVLLRSKYDDLKKKTIVLLWEKLPQGEGARMIDWAIPPVDRECVQKKTRVGCYELMEHLGDGQFASVHACKKAVTTNSDASGGWTGARMEQAQLAVKIITKEKVTYIGSLQRIDNEIRTLQELSHPGVLKLYEVIHTEKYLYMITERGGMDLFDYFEYHPITSPENARSIMRGIMAPVMYCHSLNVCHRDLKPENILLEVHDKVDDQGRRITMVDNIKLCDFGLCAKCSDDGMLDDFCGSPGFFAPEIVTEKEYNGKVTDVWSLGCILLELTIGHDSFNELWMVAYDYNNLVAPDRFAQKIGRAVESVRKVVSNDELLDLVSSLLRVAPEQRKTVLEVYGNDAASAHPWLQRTEEHPSVAGSTTASVVVAASTEPVASTNGSIPALSREGPVGSENGDGGENKHATGPPIPRLSSSSVGNVSGAPLNRNTRSSPRERLSPLGARTPTRSEIVSRPLGVSPKHRSSPALSSLSHGGGDGTVSASKVAGRHSPGLVVTEADAHEVMPPNHKTSFPPPSPLANTQTVVASEGFFDSKSEGDKRPAGAAAAAAAAVAAITAASSATS